MPRLAILTLLLLCAPLAAQETADATQAKVRALVARLADDKWEVRERSQRELVGIGEPARAQLKAALEHDDLEIRKRSSLALVAIGESFSYAVECAVSESEGLRAHGKAALSSLFRIDDGQTLRQLSPYELQMRYYGGGEDLRMTQPPALALARLESFSGLRIFVSPAAAPQWQRVLSQPSMDLNVSGDARQAAYVRPALENSLRALAGNDPAGALRVSAMRIGRAIFFYVCTAAEPAGEEQGRRAGEDLIAALLGDDARSVRAASLLAEGAATDSTASDRIRAEYLTNPDATRLMWLSLALGADDAVRAAVRKLDAAPVVKLLESQDWAAIHMAARFLECHEAPSRGKLLSALVAQGRNTLALSAALWLARGSDLSPEARARARKLLSIREDGLAAATVRWFAGAPELSDEELELVWKAAELQQAESSFFSATMELIARPDVVPRLVDRARTALSGVQETQQALAAAVLTGRATAADLTIALDKLTRRNPGLTQRLAAMFAGCRELDTAAQDKLVAGLCHDDAAIRREYAGALRACDVSLRREVAQRWATRVTEGIGEDETRAPRKFIMARVALWGFQAGMEDVKAMESLLAMATGEDAEKAKLAGGALPDAMEDAVLVKELDAMRTRAKAPHAMLVTAEVYVEFCRRAVAVGDRATFRKYFGMAITLNFQNSYLIRNELNQLQQRLNRLPDSGTRSDLLPRGFALNKLEVD